MDVTGLPKTPFDRQQASFSDLGAWHSISLPEQVEDAGSFVGPFLMTQQNGVWLGQKLISLTILDKENNPIIPKSLTQITILADWSRRWFMRILKLNRP